MRMNRFYRTKKICKFHQLSIYSDVATQYYRVKGADVIDDARKKCEQNQFEMGEQLIKQVIEKIKTNEKVAKAS